MKKKHPIKRFIIILLLLALVAGLAALPILAKRNVVDENSASILTVVPERRTLTKYLASGGTLQTPDPEKVTVPSGVTITEFLVINGDTVHAGDEIARVDDVSVMTAAQEVQASIDELASQLTELRGKITPGVFSVDDNGDFCVNGKKIDKDKLGDYADYVNVSEQHREYEEILQELFQLHQTGIVTAPCDGLVSGVDKSIVQKLSGSDGEIQWFFLASKEKTTAKNSAKASGEETKPTKEPEKETTEPDKEPSFYASYLVERNINGTLLGWAGSQVAVTDIEEFDPSSVSVSANGDSDILPIPGSSYFNTPGSPKSGDIFLYIPDMGLFFVKSTSVPDTPPVDPTQPTKPQIPDIDPSKLPGANNGGKGNTPFRIPSSLFGRGGSSGGEEEAKLYSTEKTQLCTVTQMDTLNVILPIDEMEIASLEIGMTAELTLEALPNQHFSATITEISKFGLNSGGSTKFDVTLELPGAEGMLPGMNVKAKLPLETLPDCLTLPVAALEDKGNKTVVYTGYLEESKELTNPQDVELGFSDGEYAQILSGVEPGQSIWYRYYDEVEISNAVETRRF